ncbi:MAG: glycosyltransferase [Candidatus Brocadiia bacterium]
MCVVGNSRSEHVLRWGRHFVGRGHEVHVVSIAGTGLPGARGHRLGLGTSSMPLRIASYIELAALLRPLLGRIQPDLVQAHFAYTYGAAVAWAGFHPCMLVTQGSDVLSPRLRDRLVRPLARRAVRHADAICGGSEAQLAAARELGARCPLRQMPFGVDLDRFAACRPPREDGQFRIGIFKSLLPLYGHADLLAALALVGEEHSHVRLVIAGDGPLRGKLEAQAAQQGVARCVDFLGRVPHERVPEVMATLDAVVLTSYSEGLPNMVLEAFAMGLPAIATGVGGVPEIVKPGHTGLLVPPGDPRALAWAISALIADPRRREAMGRAARSLVEAEFDCRKHMDRMEAMCRQLV